jgi:hypothetical protein
MKVQTTNTWSDNSKTPIFFRINDTIEFGLSFRRIKFLTRDLSSIKELESLHASEFSYLYYFTLSLFVFKIIVRLN